MSTWKGKMQAGKRGWDDEIRNFEIDPDFYTHTAIQNVLEASRLSFGQGANLADALMHMVIEVDKLEGLLFADGTMDPEDAEYKASVEKFKEGLNQALPVYVRDAKVAQHRFRLLYGRVMQNGAKNIELTIRD